MCNNVCELKQISHAKLVKYLTVFSNTTTMDNTNTALSQANVKLNQICFCKKQLKKMKKGTTLKVTCNCCCKEYDLNEMGFYWCDGADTCKYFQISAISYGHCAKCFNRRCTYVEEDEMDFISFKTKANMKIIS